MRKLDHLIYQAMVQARLSFQDAVTVALQYQSQAAWKKIDHEHMEIWIFNQAIVLHHRLPYLEHDKYWRGEDGNYEGTIANVAYCNNQIYLTNRKFNIPILSFRRDEIVAWWIAGNKIEFFRPNLGWIELDTIFDLPQSEPLEIP